jgi:cobyrinic acid a,c-diamide synthase
MCVDCTKTTRTMAAVIAGCVRFDPEVMVRGVILNHVAGARHESILRRSIEHYSGVPVIGALPKLGRQILPERHMGLVPTAEHGWAAGSIQSIGRIGAKHIDLGALMRIAGEAPRLSGVCRPSDLNGSAGRRATVQPVLARIGILRDSAFQFYYPENIEALEAAGAQIVFVSPLREKSLPEIDALYIGGGFPETHALELAENKGFSIALRELADAGLPIYAECGGLMYLGEELVLEGKSFPMAGVLPLSFGLFKRPQGHGYTVVSVERENPYYPAGAEIRGHEFHYSRVLRWSGAPDDFVFRMRRGVGIHGDRDGILHKNVLATYTHIHASGNPGWASALVRNAVAFRSQRARA